MKKFALLLLVIMLVASASVPSFGSEKSTSYTNDPWALVTAAINKIQDTDKRDTIKDILLTPIYSISVTDENANAMETPQLEVEEIVNLINDLSALSNDNLNNIIQDRIETIIETAKSDPNVTLLESGYNVLEKYVSPLELDKIKEIKKPASIKLSDSNIMSSLVYNKSGTKNIYNLLIYIGSITLNVKWTVENGKIIEYFPEITATAISTCEITDSDTPPFYLGQRAYVEGKVVWLPGFTGTITGWFYNDGVLDIY